MSLKLLININQWLNVVCTHDAVPHPCSGQKLFRLTHPQLPSISSPSTIRQAMPCILKNTVCISFPYVVVCMHIQQTCSADTAKPAMLSNSIHATRKGSLMVAPQSVLNHSLIPRPSPALFLDHICDLLLPFLDWMCDLSKVTCGQESSLGMKLAEPSVLIMNFADEVRPACGCVLVCMHLDKRNPWVQVWQWGLAVNSISGLSWWRSLLSGWFYLE